MSSQYPAALDSFGTSHIRTDRATGHAAMHNDLGDAVNKIQAELGVTPSSGTFTTVTARLDSGMPPLQLSAYASGGGDSTTAIQTALDDARTQGRPLYVNPGIDFRTKVLQVRSNDIIFGAGRGSTLKFIDNAGTDLGSGGRRGLIEPKDYATTTVTGVTIRDLKLLGNSAGQWGGGASPGTNNAVMLHGFMLTRAQHWLIENLWSEDMDGDAGYLGTLGNNMGAFPASHNTIRNFVGTLCMRNGFMFGGPNEHNTLENFKLLNNQQALVPGNPKNNGQLDPYTSAELDIEANAIGSYGRYNNIKKGFISGPTRGIQMADSNPQIGHEFEAVTVQDCGLTNIAISAVGADDIKFGVRSIMTNPASTATHLRVYGSTRIKLKDAKFLGGTTPANGAFAITFDAGGIGAPAIKPELRRCTFDFANSGNAGGKTIRIDSAVTSAILDNPGGYVNATLDNRSGTSSGSDIAASAVAPASTSLRRGSRSMSRQRTPRTMRLRLSS